ncbi:MAG: PAS domain S-box protein [Candidatus Thorarchaeota archaeon]
MPGSKNDSERFQNRADEYLDVALAAILVLDENGAVTLVNKKGCEILEYAAHEIIGENWFNLVVDEENRPVMDQVFSGMLDGVVEDFDYYNSPTLTKSGKTKIVSWRYSVLPATDSSPLSVLCSGIDITEHVQAVEDLKRNARTATLYIDLMTHDIKNHLQGMQLVSELMRFKNSDPDVANMLDELKFSVDYINNLIRKVAKIKSLFEIPLTERFLKKTLNQVVNLFQEQHDEVIIDLQIDIPEDVPVSADAFLETLLMNVLENAWQHNPNSEKKIWVSLYKKDRGVEIAIADNGIGINDELKRAVYGSSWRLKGVGIQQVKQIIGKYQGRFDLVDRVPGTSEEGLKILVWLPVKK